MTKQVNFEVQVMQGGRWTIHARFPSTGREESVEEAKQIESGGIGAVRVLRDVYDTVKGASEEFTIYSTKGHEMNKPRLGGGQDWADESDDDDDDIDFFEEDGFYDEDAYKEIKQKRKERKERKARLKRKEREAQRNKAKSKPSETQTSLTGLLIKLLFIVLLGVGLASTTVAVASPYIEGANFFGTVLHGNAKENALIYLFLGTFTATTLILSSVLLRDTRLKAGQRRARAMRGPPRHRRRPQHAGGTQQGAAAAAPATDDSGAPMPSEMNPETDEMARFREEAARGQTAAESTDKPSSVFDGSGLPPVEEPGLIELSPHAEKQKTFMMGFIKSAMDETGQETKNMSNFDKFGISLFMAGACESLGQNRELDEESRARIVTDSVQTMGFKRSHATTFADKYDEYLVQDPTYMQMFQAGRNAMSTYLTDETHIGKNMENALKEWNKPKVKEVESGPVTVLFTDIAGSTAMTQALGDAGAQHVVRAHNRIVREALSMWGGKEVKHTGDGIMASFVKTSDSLDASMQIQRESGEYTEQTPDKPLHIKIGINAGEPISEDNDLFGSTVQMSARIVDKAKADEIFVSEIVRGICAGKSYKFVNRGTYPMKGFDTDPILYEVVWNDA